MFTARSKIPFYLRGSKDYMEDSILERVHSAQRARGRPSKGGPIRGMGMKWARHNNDLGGVKYKKVTKGGGGRFV